MFEGRNVQERFNILSGVGGNGKSKLIELLEMVLGDYIARVPTTLFTKTSVGANQATPILARLKGVRCITAQETEENERFNISILKELTGNDKIIARDLFSKPIEFKPQFKPLFCCNDKPELPPNAQSIWRRVVTVEFPARFVEEPDPNNKLEFKRDNDLAHKFEVWKGPFLWMLFNHYKKRKSDKSYCSLPSEVKASTLEYQQSNDALRDFVIDVIIKDVNASIRIDEMYTEFKTWWVREMGNKIAPMKKNEMKPALEMKLGKYDAKSGWKGYTFISKVTESYSESCILQADVI
jgi:putative DNA primase/helicase